MKDVEVKEVVITTLARAGKGVQADPVRKVIQVWEKNGELIAERDDFLLKKLENLDSSPSHDDVVPRHSERGTACPADSEGSKESQKLIDVLDLNIEPEILAAFPRILGKGEYPTKEWYEDVCGMLNANFMAEPKGNRHDILAQALKFINKKIRSMP